MNSSDSAFQTIVHTVAGELSDLTDLAQATRIIFKLLLAALLGGMLGYEREASGKAAGLRTHMLVAMGSATFLAVAQLMGMTPMDSSRVIQGLVAGVGFLGAGAILKPAKENTEDVKGLTTAAGIWFTAAIGMAVGAGEEAAAILCALFALFVLMVLPKNVVPRKDGSPAEQRQPE